MTKPLRPAAENRKADSLPFSRFTAKSGNGNRSLSAYAGHLNEPGSNPAGHTYSPDRLRRKGPTATHDRMTAATTIGKLFAVKGKTEKSNNNKRHMNYKHTDNLKHGALRSQHFSIASAASRAAVEPVHILCGAHRGDDALDTCCRG